MCISLEMACEVFYISSCYCRAYVEVKPLLFVEDAERANITMENPSSVMLPNPWGFQHAHWHDSCIQKCVVGGKICAVLLSVTEELVAKICSESLGAKNDGDHRNSLIKGHMEKVSRFCIYLLDKVVMENDFSWENITVSFLDLIFQLQLIFS